MEKTVITVTEQFSSGGSQSREAVRAAVSLWLTKELCK